MIVQSKMRWSQVSHLAWKTAVVMLAYAAAIVLLYKSCKDSVDISIPMAVPALLGTTISILLGFRTNSAYDRWWEARKIWGAIVNDSRTLARQVLSLFVLPEGAEDRASEMAGLQKEMIYRQIAWNYTLNHSLRGRDPFPAQDGLLSKEEIEGLRAQDNRASAILHTQAVRLQDAHQRGFLDRFFLLPIENTLTRFSDHMGMCERIKSTVFPTQYDYLVSRSIWLFFLLLPSGLVPSLGWMTVPVSFLVSLVFVLIQLMGKYLQNPFENTSTDTPMDAICRTIEINLRQQLGETDLPEKVVPVDGVLT